MAKLPDLGLLFFYRVVIPGAVIVLVTGPLLLRLFPLLGITDATAQVTASAVLAAAIGFVLSALDDPIYEFYEGRHGWPDGIRKWATKRLAHKVARLYRAAEAAKDTEYNEIWSELRHYPLDAEAKPFVARPTEMGNILAAYEDYSYRTYGMDADFYWPRLWLVLDDRPLSRAGAVGVSFLACGLHQVIFHPLFALPFLPWLWARGRRWTAILYLVAIVAFTLFWLNYWTIALAHTAPGSSAAGLLQVPLLDRIEADRKRVV